MGRQRFEMLATIKSCARVFVPWSWIQIAVTFIVPWVAITCTSTGLFWLSTHGSAKPVIRAPAAGVPGPPHPTRLNGMRPTIRMATELRRTNGQPSDQVSGHPLKFMDRLRPCPSDQASCVESWKPWQAWSESQSLADSGSPATVPGGVNGRSSPVELGGGQRLGETHRKLCVGQNPHAADPPDCPGVRTPTPAPARKSSRSRSAWSSIADGSHSHLTMACHHHHGNRWYHRCRVTWFIGCLDRVPIPGLRNGRIIPRINSP